MIRKVIDIPIYNGRLIMLKVYDWGEINKKYGYNLDDLHKACVFKDFNDEIVVVFKGEASPSIIAHEAVHIVNHVFKDRGVKLDVENDEPYAYFIGWVVIQTTRFLYKVQSDIREG